MGGLPADNHVRECPYGHGGSQFKQLFTTADNTRVDPKNDKSPWQTNAIGAYKCVVCGGPLFVRARGSGLEQIDEYPIRVPEAPSEVQSPVREAYIEAQSCFNVRAWNAVATMCRRTVQGAVVKLGGTGDNLFEQIEDLASKRVITDDLKDWAHEVRGIGRDGAHLDLLTNVSEQDAEDALAFTKELLNYAFVMKQRVQKRKPQPAGLTAAP